jgi:hypothetical protein
MSGTRAAGEPRSIVGDAVAREGVVGLCDTFFLTPFDLFRRAATRFRHAFVDDCSADAGR